MAGGLSASWLLLWDPVSSLSRGWDGMRTGQSSWPSVLSSGAWDLESDAFVWVRPSKRWHARGAPLCPASGELSQAVQEPALGLWWPQLQSNVPEVTRAIGPRTQGSVLFPEAFTRCYYNGSILKCFCQYKGNWMLWKFLIHPYGSLK